jgi:hypothetical protein
MKMIRLIAFLALSASIALAQTQVAPPPKPRGVMAEANADILKLLQAKLSESVVLSKIRATKTPFDTSVDAILALKRAAATDNEINAILALETDATASSTAPNQPAAAPPQGPTLEETLNFIAEQIKEQGSLAYSLSEPGGAGLVSTDTYTYSNPHPDPAKCALSWTLQDVVKMNGSEPAASNSMNFILNLKKVKSVQVQSLQDMVNRVVDMPLAIVPPIQMAVFGNPELNTDGSSRFFFTDANRADRVAQAISHAAELCGASKDPF